MKIDLSRITRRQIWIGIAVIAGLFGLWMLFTSTGPKMMSSGPEGGASPFDLLGAWGPIAAAVAALIKGIMTRNPLEVVNAILALASSPQSAEQRRRAEVAIIDLLREQYKSNPAVLEPLAVLSVELAKVGFDETTDSEKGPA